MLTKREFLRSAGLGAVAAAAAPEGPAQAALFKRVGFFEAKAIAEEGFVYGLPIVMNYAVMYDFVINRDSGQFKAPFNEIGNERRVFTYKDTTVVTPNSDTPYSMVWMDLRAESIVLSVPAVDPKRYYSVQLIDASTNNYGYIGSRATGSEAGDYLVAGPDWKGEAPAGIKKVFRSASALSLAIFRTQLFAPEDMPNVIKVQDGYKAQALSAFLKQAAPPAAPKIDFPKIDKQLAKTNFFEFLDFALQFIPEQPNEKDIRAKLAKIGVGPGKSFAFKDLSIEEKLWTLLGMKEGENKVERMVATAGSNVDGWRIGGLAGGDSAFFNGNWLLRAGVAKAGIYANSPEEAAYPFTRNDSDGRPLDGARRAYTLTFPVGSLPPVNAFWSVTLYDGKTQLLVQNPIDRYLINSPMLPNLKKNPDGSLTLTIQNKSPGPDKELNWLPAPAGPIYLVMRLYWPKTEPPSLLPLGSGTWKPPGLKRA